MKKMLCLLLALAMLTGCAAGLIGSGGIIAAIIPPSIPLIIFGVSSGLSISKLFMAGIAPGIMMGVTLMVT